MTRTRRSIAAALALATIAVSSLVAVDLAGACSCIRLDPREELAKGRPAVIGQVTDSRPEGNRPFPQDRVYTLQVERALNFEPGATVQVQGGTDGGACGFDWKVGERVGAFLERDGTTWTTGLCSLVEPDDLLRALDPYPEAIGKGRPALLAGGRFTGARVMALDRRGRILAYGRGRGAVTQISVCPGSRVAAELVDRGRRGTAVALRSLRTLAVTRQARVPRSTTTVRCADRQGRRVFTADTRYPRKQPLGVTRIARLRGHGTVAIASARGATVAIGRARAYVAGRRAVLSIGLRTGATRRLMTADRPSGLAPSPDGRLLAVHTRSGLRLLDLRTGGIRTDPNGGAPMTWLDPHRLVASRSGVHIYDRRLERRRVSRFYFGGQALLGHRLVEIAGYELRTIDLRTSRRATLTRLPDPDTHVLSATPGAPRLSLPKSAPAKAAGKKDPCPLRPIPLPYEA